MPVSSTRPFQKSFPATFSTRSGPTAQAKGQASVMAIVSTTGPAAKTGIAAFMPVATELALAEASENVDFSRLSRGLTQAMVVLYYLSTVD
jgi:hypothetical protein